jgi:hypothetical protein
MIQTINRYQFIDAFAKAGRKEQFSYDALNVLFEYFEEVDPDMELDVIAICCEYAEGSAAEIAAAYDIDLSAADPEDYEQSCIDIVRDYLEQHMTTIVGGTSHDTFVYVQF